jgi:hypothetical protein
MMPDFCSEVLVGEAPPEEQPGAASVAQRAPQRRGGRRSS